MLKNGADEIVYLEKQLAEWCAIRYSSNHVFDYIKLAEGYSIFEVEVPKSWAGKTVVELDIRKKYNINLLAFKNEGSLNLAITPLSMFKEGDRILVLGSDKNIQKCFKI